MAGRSAGRYKTGIVRRMKSVGTYREEYKPTIERLAALYVQRDKIEAEFAASGEGAVIAHTNKAGATNVIKNPYLTALNEIYAQLIAHERELGLTPMALKKLSDAATKPERKKSPLEEALEKAMGDAKH